MGTFEQMVEDVVDKGLEESAVIYYYFLTHYPYLQGMLAPQEDGEEIRMDLDRKFSEIAPPGWKGTVKAMKKHRNISNPFALAWAMKNRGAKSHRSNKE